MRNGIVIPFQPVEPWTEQSFVVVEQFSTILTKKFRQDLRMTVVVECIPSLFGMNESDSPQTIDAQFVTLLAQHEPTIRGYLRALLPSAMDVDAVMPEVALVAWRKFQELADHEAFGRWACVIARYEVLRYRRDKARDRFVLDEELLARIAEEGLSEISGREQQMVALERCLDKLSLPRRQLVLGCYTPGSSIREIAARSGQSEEGLYQLLRRIRLKLKDCVETTLNQEAMP